MRQVREIVRWNLEDGLSTRVLGERIGIGPPMVRDTLKRFVRAGLGPCRSDKRGRAEGATVRGSWREAGWPQGAPSLTGSLLSTSTSASAVGNVPCRASGRVPV